MALHPCVKQVLCTLSSAVLNDLKLIISGLTSGLHWHLYYEITEQKYRSSQESYLNTLNLIISILGYSFLGLVIENLGLEWAISLLCFTSLIAIAFLYIAKDPNFRKKQLLKPNR